MTRQRADGDCVAPELDERQARHMREIDQNRGTRHPEIQQGHQGLSAGHHLAVAIRRRERLDRCFEAARRNIVEGGRLHCAAPESSPGLTFALQAPRAI